MFRFSFFSFNRTDTTISWCTSYQTAATWRNPFVENQGFLLPISEYKFNITTAIEEICSLAVSHARPSPSKVHFLKDVQYVRAPELWSSLLDLQLWARGFIS